MWQSVWLSVLSCGSVCRSCVTVIARLASTHTALVSQSLVGLCFAFPSINQSVYSSRWGPAHFIRFEAGWCGRLFRSIPFSTACHSPISPFSTFRGDPSGLVGPRAEFFQGKRKALPRRQALTRISMSRISMSRQRPRISRHPLDTPLSLLSLLTRLAEENGRAPNTHAGETCFG